MSQHPTGIACPVCAVKNTEGEIVVDVQGLTTKSFNCVFGELSLKGCISKQTAFTFHCNVCKLMYFGVPGEPNVTEEIIRKIRRDEGMEDGTSEYERLRELFARPTGA